ncbi:MAG: phosphoribosylformylglycinamidine synthase I [Acidimicrobiia bacterium]|nr:phosphoribosylformylglycinamidine synthase I [Acidimicrobiia bacterium]NNF63571.1 phosphoribosylformylglycinamidine synthase I [Acidimicrobiia bacterium]
MRTAVVVFPGTNCERDVVYALGVLGARADLVWHRETDLSSFAGVILPGGFAHGDYLRTGAIARFSPVMDSVKAMADAGQPVLGICNGFQVLCEAGLLPGALVANRDLSFICRPVHLRVESTDSILTRSATVGDVLEIPLNSYEGNFVVPEADREALHTVLRYSDAQGGVDDDANPNGSFHNIAGVANRRGNVAGVMPHPERAVEDLLGSTDGRILLESYLASLAPIHV